MRFADLFGIAFGNLRRQKLRMSLTAFGVLVGTAAIVLMVSLGIGLQEQTISLFNQVDFLTTIRVLPQKRSKSFMTFGKAMGPAAKVLDDETVEQIRRMDGVLCAYPALGIYTRLQIERVVDGKKKPVIGGSVEFVGLPQSGIMPLYRKALIAGKLWDEENPAERCVVVPADMLHEMGLAPPLPGKAAPGETPAGRNDPRWDAVLGLDMKFKFEVPIPAKEPKEGDPKKPGDPPPDEPGTKPDPEETDPSKPPPDPDAPEEERAETRSVIRRFKIIGIYDATDIGMPWAPAVFMPLAQGVEIAKVRSTRQPWVDTGYQGILVKAVDASRTEDIRRALDAQGYGTLTVQDIVQVIGSIFDVLKAVLGAVASIGLFVAFFGITNTMVMAILERTREIGVMKALGARASHIRRLFLVEAAAIGAFGGATGVAMGWALGKLLNRVGQYIVERNGGPPDIKLFSVSPALAAGTLGFAIVVSVVAGLYPAWRAARLNPVDALRSL